MTPPAEHGLDDLASGLAEELGQASMSSEDGAEAWARGEVRFAKVTSAMLEVKLPDDIAEAALRTPDTSAIEGQSGWIRFAPGEDAGHVVDRAQAWFVTAWRHADRG